MRRWLGIFLAIGLVSSSAHAQVFKPTKAKKAAATEKKAAADPDKKSAKKARAGATKKRPAKKKTSAADRGSPDDLTPEPESKGAGKDYVKIWDDDEIE